MLRRTPSLLLLVLPLAAAAAEPVPVIHPIYVSLPASPHEAAAHRLFGEAAGRVRLGPVEVMDPVRPPTARAPELLREGGAALEKLKFAEAEAALDAAAAEVARTGGEGLEPAQLAELFLLQAIAAQRADWKELPAPPAEIAPAKAREAYLRAATLAPDRVLQPRRYPPLAIASFALATAEVKRRPRGNLLVRATPTAQVSIDAGPALLSPATAIGLAYGEHFVRVEDAGREPWSAVVPLTEPSMEIEAPPARPLSVDDGDAAARARRMGARFALVARLKPGTPPELELRLLEAASAAVRDAATVPLLGEAGVLDAAVMRLDEEARRQDLLAGGATRITGTSDLAIATVPTGRPRDAGPSFDQDPGAWARQRWPLLTAIGVTVGAAILLGVAVSLDDR